VELDALRRPDRQAVLVLKLGHSVTLERFLSERNQSWQELDELVRRARRRPERLGSEGVFRLGTLYRAAAADLARARRLFPADPVVERLEQPRSPPPGPLYPAPTPPPAAVPSLPPHLL